MASALLSGDLAYWSRVVAIGSLTTQYPAVGEIVTVVHEGTIKIAPAESHQLVPRRTS
jgi:hypothetical protein